MATKGRATRLNRSKSKNIAGTASLRSVVMQEQGICSACWRSARPVIVQGKKQCPHCNAEWVAKGEAAGDDAKDAAE